MADAGLFDAEPLREPPPPPAPPATRGERLRARQRGAIAVGLHPLSLTSAPYLRLHPDATREVDGAGPHCGGCRFRGHQNGGQRAYPKCLWPDPEDWRTWRRATHGDATDVRRAWPACADGMERERDLYAQTIQDHFGPNGPKIHLG